MHQIALEIKATVHFSMLKWMVHSPWDTQYNITSHAKILDFVVVEFLCQSFVYVQGLISKLPQYVSAGLTINVGGTHFDVSESPLPNQ